MHSFHKIFLPAIKGAVHWGSRQVLMTTTGTRSGNSHFNSGTLHRCNVLILDVSARLIRGDPFITFAPRGMRGVRKVANCANNSTDRLRENANEGGRGSKIPKILQT